jgi:acyl-CoA synthetase (AMP-forming)/AMP-acid ligase II
VAVGCEVAVVVDGQVAPTGSGPVLVRGPQVMAGYLGRSPGLTDGWFRTGDLGALDEAGFLTLTGREADTINRGGEKVAPGEIDGVLAAHPSVVEAATFAVPHETLGEDVVAAVVLDRRYPGDVADIERYLRSRLASHKLPTRVEVVPAIPRGEHGKLRRRSLARELGFAP